MSDTFPAFLLTLKSSFDGDRDLPRQADEALAVGDRERCVEIIYKIYELLDLRAGPGAS